MAKSHNIGFQALNQARIACRAKAYIEGAVAVENPPKDANGSSIIGPYIEFFSLARKSMRENSIMILASVLDEDDRSWGLKKLIQEALILKQIDEDIASSMIARIGDIYDVVRRCIILRSSFIAHRSNRITYANAVNKFDVSNTEIIHSVNVLVDVAQELSFITRGYTWNVSSDPSGAIQRLYSDIEIANSIKLR